VLVPGCGWQPGRPCGLSSPPPLPPLLSDGGEVHGTDDESTAAMSRSDRAAAGGSQCYSGRWSSSAANMHVNGGGVTVDVGGSSAQRWWRQGASCSLGGHGASAVSPYPPPSSLVALICAGEEAGGLAGQPGRL
jgi:hypothetical protein